MSPCRRHDSPYYLCERRTGHATARLTALNKAPRYCHPLSTRSDSHVRLCRSRLGSAKGEKSSGRVRLGTALRVTRPAPPALCVSIPDHLRYLLSVPMRHRRRRSDLGSSTHAAPVNNELPTKPHSLIDLVILRVPRTNVVPALPDAFLVRQNWRRPGSRSLRPRWEPRWVGLN